MPQGARVYNAQTTRQMLRDVQGTMKGGDTYYQEFHIVASDDEDSVQAWENYAAFQGVL